MSIPGPSLPPAARRSAERAAEMERRFQVPMLFVAALVIPSIVLDQAQMPPFWEAFGFALSCFIWAAFAFELGVMLSVVPDRRAYLRSHPIELLVVVLTVPVLAAAASSVAALRLLRLARLLQLAPVLRWLFRSSSVKYALAFVVAVVLASGGAFALAETGEDYSYGDGVYWAITTMTTVGYGDILPTTNQTRALSVVLMVVGLAFAAVLTAALAEQFLRDETDALQEADVRSADAEAQIIERIEQLSAQIGELRRELGERAPPPRGPPVS